MRLAHLLTTLSWASATLAFPSPQDDTTTERRRPSSQKVKDGSWWDPLMAALGGVGGAVALGYVADEYYFKQRRMRPTPLSSASPNTGIAPAQEGETLNGPDRHALDGIRDEDITADILDKARVGWTSIDFQMWAACLKELADNSPNSGDSFSFAQNIACHRRVLDAKKAARIQVREGQAGPPPQGPNDDDDQGLSNDPPPQPGGGPRKHRDPSSFSLVEGAAKKIGASGWAFAAGMPKAIRFPKYIPRPVVL